MLLQFIPRNFMERCRLVSSAEIAMVDCLGRTHSAVVETRCGVSYVGEGWADFLRSIGAVRGDMLLLMFESIRTCKFFVFNGRSGWQKYPTIEEQQLDRVLMPRQGGMCTILS